MVCHRCVAHTTLGCFLVCVSWFPFGPTLCRLKLDCCLDAFPNAPSISSQAVCSVCVCVHVVEDGHTGDRYRGPCTATRSREAPCGCAKVFCQLPKSTAANDTRTLSTRDSRFQTVKRCLAEEPNERGTNRRLRCVRSPVSCAESASTCQRSHRCWGCRRRQ